MPVDWEFTAEMGERREEMKRKEMMVGWLFFGFKRMRIQFLAICLAWLRFLDGACLFIPIA